MQNEEKNTKLVNMVVQTQCQVPSNQYNLQLSTCHRNRYPISNNPWSRLKYHLKSSLMGQIYKTLSATTT